MSRQRGGCSLAIFRRRLRSTPTGADAPDHGSGPGLPPTAGAADRLGRAVVVLSSWRAFGCHDDEGAPPVRLDLSVVCCNLLFSRASSPVRIQTRTESALAAGSRSTYRTGAVRSGGS